jgi:general secretion pathway protein N
MKPGRAFKLLTGVALLGGIAKFNEMTPDAQAAFIGAAADTARTTTQSLVTTAVATYGEMTAQAPQAQIPPQAQIAQIAPQPAAPQPPAAQRQAAAQPLPDRPGAPPAYLRQQQPATTTGDAPPPRSRSVRTADASETPATGNPLWTMPVKQLSMTRDRPLFSPSRRPPPPPQAPYVAPVAVRQPVKPAEPEKPAVSLLGTIIGSGADDRIGVFLETGTQSIVRLRVGEDHQGWVLRLIKAREVTLVKDREQAVTLELPAPGDAPPPGLGFGGGMPIAGAMPGLPPGAIPTGTLPIPGQPPRRDRDRRQGK